MSKYCCAAAKASGGMSCCCAQNRREAEESEFMKTLRTTQQTIERVKYDRHAFGVISQLSEENAKLKEENEELKHRLYSVEYWIQRRDEEGEMGCGPVQFEMGVRAALGDDE